MQPSLKSGDIVFASPLPYLLKKPKLNDLVLLIEPKNRKIIVKRITKIDKQMYYVIGDNPGSSTDSKDFGYIKRRDIIGKVMYVKKGY